MITSVDLSIGEIDFKINVNENLFFRELSKLAGEAIQDNKDLISYLDKASQAKKEYDKLEGAIRSANERGYGVVVPAFDEMELMEPEIVKKGASNGLKLKAKAPSYHIMRVDVESEVVPAVGGGLIEGATTNEDGSSVDKDMIWNTSMFGKTMADIAHDTIVSKLNGFPEEAEIKMRKTLSKITNEGNGGIICILL